MPISPGPVWTASDAAMLGAVADMTVAVAQDGRYTSRELGTALRSLRADGVVFCRVPLKRFARRRHGRRALRD